MRPGSVNHTNHQSSSAAECLEFLEIFRKVENHLYCLAGVVVLVVAVHVGFELLTVTNDLLAPLLESYLHVLSACGPNVSPERHLLTGAVHRSDVLRANSAPLRVGHVLLPHRPATVLRRIV